MHSFRTTFVLAAVLLLLSACGSRQADSTVERRAGPDIAAELNRLEAQPLPSGVDPVVWNELKAALSAALLQHGRYVSTPPQTDASQAVLSFDTPSLTLSWLYFSQGDYDQNGEVGISDLTPIAQHFGETSGGGSFDPATVQSVVDGDGNGEINIADVSPIGINFGRAVASYNVYRSLNIDDVPAVSSDPNGPGTQLLGNVPFSAAVGNKSQQRLTFSFTLASANLAWFYWVRPNDATDGSGADGTPSSLVSLGGAAGNTPPVAVISADPLTGTAPLTVSFDASASSDADGNGIVQFEWDFEGDGNFDQISPLPNLQHTYTQPGVFTPTLRVLDDGAASDTDSAVLSINGGLNQPPVAAISADPATGEVPFDCSLDASGSVDDNGLANLSFEWDFDGDGIFDLSTSTPQVVHNYNVAGAVDATVRVTDGGALKDTASVSVTATVAGNEAPVATLDPDEFSGDAPLTISFDPSGSVDPDGDIVLYRFDFDGDGNFEFESPTPDVQPVAYGAAGTYVVALEVIDDQAARSQDSCTVTVTGGWQLNTILGLGTSKVPDIAIAPFNKSNAADSRLHVAFSKNDKSISHLRSTNNIGTDWDAPVVANFGANKLPNAGFHLGVVQLRPAIAYIDQTAGQVRYIRATDEAGTNWPGASLVAPVTAGSGVALAIVEGLPAVSYYENDASGQEARFARATTTTGVGIWTGSERVLDGAPPFSALAPRTHLQVTSGGEPAVLFNAGPLLANDSKDKTGSEWPDGGKQAIASDILGFGAILEASDSGIAAVVLRDTGDNLPRLQCVTTENAFGVGSGSSWDEVVNIVPTRTLGDNVVLRRHGSKAAVIYLDTGTHTLKYVESTSGTGLTWGLPQVIDFGIESDVFDMIQIGSTMVVVYFDPEDQRLESATLVD